MLRPRHAIVVCCAATTSVFASIGAAPTARAEEASAADCVQFQLVSAERAITYSVENSCARAVGCTLTWRLRCGEEERQTVATQRRRFRVDGAGGKEVTVDTSTCRSETWSVEGVAWACR